MYFAAASSVTVTLLFASVAVAILVYSRVCIDPEVVVSSTVHPVTPVGSDRTRVLALRVSESSRRSPADTVVGVVTFGVETLPWFTALPTKKTVLGWGAPTTTSVAVASSVASWLSVTSSVISYVPGSA